MAAGTKVQLRLGDRVVAEVAFHGDELRIGRMKENDLVINNLAVSRFHAVLRRVGEAIEVEDLGSENGTFVDGIAVKGRAVVPAGAELAIGKHMLTIRDRGEGGTQPPQTGRSDAWDAAQTYFAPELAPRPAPLAEPAAPEELEAEVVAEANEESALDLGAPLAAQAEAWVRPPPSSLDLPDPGGLYAFGDEDLAEPPAAVAATPRAAEYDVSAPEPAAPALGGQTALFDFGAEADLGLSDGSLARAAEAVATPPASAPAPAPAPAVLHAGLIVARAGKLERVVALRGDEFVVGRGPRCDLVLAAAGVSRRHARFVRDGEAFRVLDLGSANGIRVNGERAIDHLLRQDDVVQVEDYTLTFVLDRAPLDEALVPPPAAASAPAAAHLTVLHDAPFSRFAERDLVTAPDEDEASLDAEKELEVAAELSTPLVSSRVAEATLDWVVELTLSEEQLPPALREALRSLGTDGLRLPAEVRLRRKA